MERFDFGGIMDYNFWMKVKKANDWMWVYSSTCVMVPSMIIALFKIYQYRSSRSDLKDTLLNRNLSLAYKILNCYCLIYYTLDCLTFAVLGFLAQRCYQFFLLHHFASIYALGNAFHYTKQIFWFEAFVGSMHSIVLAFPNSSILQYIYFASLILSHYMLYAKPYYNYDAAKRTTYCYPVAYLALILLFTFDCLGMMDVENINEQY